MKMNLTKLFFNSENFINDLQSKICSELEKCDTVKFREDIWKRTGGGGGKSKIIQNGKIFEKGGVNVSSVYGELPAAAAGHLKVKKENFAACGISIVIHPYSPKVPVIHMNLRYFEMQSGKCWFGGGIDLTPFFPITGDFIYFHSVMKEACDSIIPDSYKIFKKQCDEYFTVKHRKEMRGIGGIFFDYLDGKNTEHFSLIKSVGNSFLKAYIPIIEKRKEENFSEEDKQFQLYRRGRYVEFNLIYDRGTLFGLKTGGRIESILMSLPPVVNFPYNFRPKKGTPYFEMQKYYHPVDWLAL